MGLVADVLAAVLAAMLTLSASLKIERNERSVYVVHELARVPLTLFPVLAAVELTAAAGVILGVWSTTIGFFECMVAVAYFVGALAAYVIDVHAAAVSTLPM